MGVQLVGLLYTSILRILVTFHSLTFSPAKLISNDTFFIVDEYIRYLLQAALTLGMPAKNGISTTTHTRSVSTLLLLQLLLLLQPLRPIALCVFSRQPMDKVTYSSFPSSPFLFGIPFYSSCLMTVGDVNL